ncbi:fungal-specific transcription factor domain-containing protein [Aspergillus multicolor]|uniref:Zn(II)2Cys6 transcription factor n=1 Tax=Aspergillus multicolor TaxID=41759 RepID=UPI003CCE185B
MLSYNHALPPLANRGLRSKTGCLTCRRRRKKCDEHKPRCYNCERNNLVCDGYQSLQRWAPRNSQPRCRSPSPPCTFEPADCVSNGRTSPSPRVLIDTSSPDYTTRDIAPTASLPPLIPGVQTPVERRLFHHFTTVLAPTLALHSSSHPNAIAKAILPLAVIDPGVLDLVLSAAGSHLLRRLESESCIPDRDTYREIARTSWQRFGEGTRYHCDSIKVLSGNARKSGDPASQPQIVTALARTMLLCQQSTCSGGFDISWKVHLVAARELAGVLHGISPDWDDCNDHRALMDWIQYHELLARVTNTSLEDTVGTSQIGAVLYSMRRGNDHLILIDTQDGLFEILKQILDLRSSTQYEIEGPSLVTLQTGLTLSSELETWSYPYTTEQQRVVGECYRWACFILLHATVYASCAEDETIQTALAGGLAFLDRLDGTSNAQTCALYPMFVFGISGITEEDRERVRRKLEQYHRWAGFGNIQDTVDLLEAWWEHCRRKGTGAPWWSWQAWAAARGVEPMIV